jgi:signal peptide peptidase SppA
MSQHLARSIASLMHLRGSLLSPLHTALAADLRDIAAADPVRERAAWDVRKAELANAYGFGSSSPQEQRKPFAFADGTAVIPVHGLLINRFSGSWGFVTGYNFIRSQFHAAQADPDVERIVFDVNSPGGQAAGCEEIADEIYQARGGKPTLAMVDAGAYSAAYWIASAADKIYVSPSGGVGSIGVIAAHISLAEMLDREGIKVTLIMAGEHKADGNPYEDLTPAVRKDIQADVDAIYAQFVAGIARNRGLDESAVRATEARCYRADDAVANGLADAVQSPTRALGAFVADVDSDLEEQDDMATNTTQQPAVTAGTEQQAAAVQPSAEQLADARKAERERVGAIMGCDEAKGRGALAQHLATSTDMSADQAKAVLAVAAKEAPPAAAEAGSGFAAAMANTTNPNVGADGKDGKGGPAGAGQGDDKANKASSILRDQQMATGRTLINPDGSAVKPAGQRH